MWYAWIDSHFSAPASVAIHWVFTTCQCARYYLRVSLESCRHPLPSCSVTRKADPQWLHRRSMCPLPSVWVWPMEAWCRSLEAERRVRIRATMEKKKKRATMFWLLIQSVTSWLPSIDSHSSGGSYPLWILVTAPSSVTFCLGMVQTLCCWQSIILNQLFLVSPVLACTFIEDNSIKLSSVSSLHVLFVFFWELVWYQMLASVQFSHSVVSDSLQPHGLQHARPRCPSPTPRAYSNSCPLSRWCPPAISSSVIPFSSCLQYFPASGSFPMSQFFASGGQSIGVSASASVLPMNIQDWFPLGQTGWISLQSKGLSWVFSNTTVQKHQFFSAQLSL